MPDPTTCSFDAAVAAFEKDKPAAPESLKSALQKASEKAISRDRERAQVDRCFTYHPPRIDAVDSFTEIRETARAYANRLIDLCPAGRELSLALTKLEEVVFFANASIARTPK